MGSNASEENICASTRVHNANLRGDKHRGVPAEHAARRAAHDVEHDKVNAFGDMFSVNIPYWRPGEATKRYKRDTARRALTGLAAGFVAGPLARQVSPRRIGNGITQAWL
jgi:hypothetical protein